MYEFTKSRDIIQVIFKNFLWEFSIFRYFSSLFHPVEYELY